VLVHDDVQHEWPLVVAACEHRLRRLSRSPEHHRRDEKSETGQGDNPGQVVTENPTSSSHQSHRGNLLSRTELVELSIDSEAGRKSDRQDAERWSPSQPRNRQRERSGYSKAERNFRSEKRVVVMIEENDERCHEQEEERNRREGERPSARRVSLVLSLRWRQG